MTDRHESDSDSSSDDDDADRYCPECGGFNTIYKDWHYWICDECGKGFLENPVGVDATTAASLRAVLWADRDTVENGRRKNIEEQRKVARGRGSTFDQQQSH